MAKNLRMKDWQTDDDFFNLLLCRTMPQNLYLCVQRDNNYYYLSKYDWKRLFPYYKNKLQKVGITVSYTDGKGNDEYFILELFDAGRWDNWDGAKTNVKIRGLDLPTKNQGRAITLQRYSLNCALSDFAGQRMETKSGKNPIYWTKTECNSSNAWYVNMDTGDVGSDDKANLNRVRGVSPLPSSAR